MDRTIRTRQEAYAQGLTRYYTGKVCKHGHDAERYTSIGTCCACGASRAKTFQKTMAFRLQGFSTLTVRVPPELRETFLTLCQSLGLQVEGPDVASAPPPPPVVHIVPPGPKLPPPPPPSEPMDLSQWGLLDAMPAKYRA